MLTTVHEHQSSDLYVTLGKVQDVPGGGALQGQVAVAGWCDDELQPLGRSVRVLCTELMNGDFCHRTHPHLRNRKERWKEGTGRLLPLAVKGPVCGIY